MSTLSRRAWRKYSEEGPLAVVDGGMRYINSRASDIALEVAPDRFTYQLSRRQIQRRMQRERTLDDILDTVIEIQPGYKNYKLRAAQLREELQELATIVNERNPRTAMEIGTARGGTFYTWSRHLDSLSTLVSLDLPQGQFGGGYSKRHTSLYGEFAPENTNIFVRANSHDSATYEATQSALAEHCSETSGKVDFLFIDGDHRYEGVKQDFEMYRQLVRDEGIIALHDIATHPDREAVVKQRRRKFPDAEEKYFRWGEDWRHCNVDQFWHELTESYQTQELLAHPKQTWGGIGIVYL